MEEKIINKAAIFFGVSAEEITGKSNKRDMCDIRKMICYVHYDLVKHLKKLNNYNPNRPSNRVMEKAINRKHPAYLYYVNSWQKLLDAEFMSNKALKLKTKTLDFKAFVISDNIKINALPCQYQIMKYSYEKLPSPNRHSTIAF
jgi:hypothetical protein